MSWRRISEDYFTFTRKDRLGIVVLISLIILVFFLPALIPSSGPGTDVNDSAWLSEIKQLEQIKDSTGGQEENFQSFRYEKSYHEPVIKGELFFFDPNKISMDEWRRLGLREKTIKTIDKYLQKGGRFKTNEDLKRIYGLGEKMYERLAPFIKIERTGFSKKKEEQTTSIPLARDFNRTKHISPVNINIADTSAFIALPGIGSKLAMRIVNFREKLGGFYSVEQVGETFGLADSTFQKIRKYLIAGNPVLRKININTATLEELKAHPYIRFQLAKPIIAYRDAHSGFKQIEELKKVIAVTEEVYLKLVPYIQVH